VFGVRCLLRDVGFEARLGDLVESASEGGQFVEVSRDRPVEVPNVATCSPGTLCAR
jgi:hypothetical protein